MKFSKISRWKIVLILAIILSFSEKANATLRLPNDTVPISYDLHLTTNIHLGNFDFEGTVDITGRCLNETDRITLHSVEQEIKEVFFNSEAVKSKFVTRDETKQFLHILLPETLKEGNQFKLTIKYRGHHNGNNSGWYHAQIPDSNEWFATSQFEPDLARKAFPCYDEPNKKANFSVTITHGSHYTALSNMEVLYKTEEKNGLTTTKFATSVRMSTYLVAFIVSPMKSNCQKDDKNRLHCIYVAEQYLNETQLALETSLKAFKYFEDLLQIDYPLSKIDHVGISSQYFDDGGMENWGLITYSMGYLGNNKVMIHEIAHQWFGNLVTLDWWSYTWLNEGFARLFDTIGSGGELSLLYDAYYLPSFNKRPLTYYQEDRVVDLLDGTAYTVAARVLYMVMLAMGEQTFYKGLRYYLNNRAYLNASPEDLNKGLQRAVDEDHALPNGLTVAELMDSWTLQAGYPILKANRTSRSEVTLSSRSSLANSTGDQNQRPFVVPITYMDQKEGLRNETVFLRGEYTTISLNSDSSWYLLNKNMSGNYQVDYDEENWKALAVQLNEDHTVFSLTNRWAIVVDVRLSEPNNLQNVCSYWPKETDYQLGQYCKRALEKKVLLNREPQLFNKY